MNPFLTDTLAAIRAEAEATKPVYMASSAAVAELIAERVERGILSAAEAATIRAALCVSCGVHDFLTGGACVEPFGHAPFHRLIDGTAFAICVEDAL